VLAGRLVRGARFTVAALALALAAGLFSPAPGPAGPGAPGAEASGAISTEQRFVPDVVAQFNALALRPDGLAFDIGTSPDASKCKHYQGIARKQGPDGTPYLFVTKSGNVPTGCFGDDDYGNLLVVRMDSRDKTGERLRSNRFFRDELPHADVRDRVVTTISFDGGANWPAHGESSGWPAYGHPGGVQLIGDVLAVAMEAPYTGAPDGVVVFLDVSSPETPRFLNLMFPGAVTEDFGAGTLGVTPVRAANGACCDYLMAITGKKNRVLKFFQSFPTGGASTTDLTAPVVGWIEVEDYTEEELEADDCLGDDGWPAGLWGGHQMLNFVRQGSLDGPLYLVGARNTGLGGTGDDLLDLYEVQLPFGKCPLKHVRTTHVTSYPYGNFDSSANFAAASGIYVSPSGELIVYATEYENQGPFRWDPNTGNFVGDVSQATVPVAEYRHRNMVRPGSPTLHPTAATDGPFVVDEGSSVALTGRGAPPITRAWIQLFEDDGAGASLPGFFDTDEWLAVDYADRDADNFDAFDALIPFESFMWENAGSWRWFAPVGCTISANDFPIHSTSFPGPDTVLLRGTGQVEQVNDLDALPVYVQVPDDPSLRTLRISPVPAGQDTTVVNFADDIEGVSFFHVDEFGNRVNDCDGYYNAPIGLAWDLNNDGSFETSGTSVTFSAAALDGPTTATVQARAQHPTDPTPLGSGVPLPVPVEVRNVAPQIASAAVTDSLGRDVGTPGTFVLAGLPLTLDVRFTDPGVADTQTAAVDWGDGAADTTFDAFSDARGGGVGRLRHAHTFASPGTYDIVTTITDDDGGVTQVMVTVEVLSPADAIEAIADRLSDLISTATDPAVGDALRKARDQLIGNHAGTRPTNGALDKLDEDDPVGAITKIAAAISYLQQAEALGAGDLSAMKDPLGLVAEAIATGAYHDAQAAVEPPSPGEARTLAGIAGLIARGHQRLSVGQYLDACDSFRQATAKALKLSG
jgi:hypothetical protein